MLDTVTIPWPSTPVLVGATSVVGVLLWLIRRLYPRPFPGIPYNASSARRVLGDMPEMVSLVQQIHQQAEPLFAVSSRRLGVPVAQVLFPGFFRPPLIVVEDVREAADIALRRNRDFDKAPLFIDIERALLPRATISMYSRDPQFRTQRRMWQDAMGTEFLGRAAAPSIHRATVQLLELWRLRADNEKHPFDVHEDLANAALDMAWTVLAGTSSGVTEYEMAQLKRSLERGHPNADAQAAVERPSGMIAKDFMDYLNATMGWVPQTPVPWLFMELEKCTFRYRRHMRRAEHEMDKALRKGLERFQKNEAGVVLRDSKDGESAALDTCALDLVLRRRALLARKEGREQSDPLTDRGMIDEMMSFLVGAHDSTANSLSWFVKFLSMYLDAQRTLREALLAAFPDLTTSGLPTAEQLVDAGIPYLDAVVEEGFRLAGTSKAILRQAVTDTWVLGCPVPKGAELLLNIHSDRPPLSIAEEKRSPSSRAAADKVRPVGRDHDLQVFEPRRWLVHDEKTGREVFDAYALTSLPFGGGLRGCFGRKLAYMEFRIVVALLVLTFEFLPLPEEMNRLDCTETAFRQPDVAKARVRVLR